MSVLIPVCIIITRCLGLIIQLDTPSKWLPPWCGWWRCWRSWMNLTVLPMKYVVAVAFASTVLVHTCTNYYYCSILSINSFEQTQLHIIHIIIIALLCTSPILWHYISVGTRPMHAEVQHAGKLLPPSPTHIYTFHRRGGTCSVYLHGLWL